MSNFALIDYLQLFMSMVVVAIHTHLFADLGCPLMDNLFRIISSMAVPFFFIASGFFLFYNRPQTKEAQIQLCFKAIRKITRLYICWTLIYFPLTVVGFLRDGLSLKASTGIFFRNFLLVGENYYSWPLWYCLALIVAIVLICFCIQIGLGIYRILFISFVFYVFGQIIDLLYLSPEWNDFLIIYKKYFVSTRNGLFNGFFAVSLGMFIAKTNMSLSIRYLLPASMFSAIGSYAGYPLGLLTAFILFLIALNAPRPQLKVDNIKCREASVIIFFLHMYIIYALVNLGIHSNSIETFILTILISFVMVYILFYFRTTKAYKLLFC